MPVLEALRQLLGDWGNVAEGDLFNTDEETALNLESRGLAIRWRPPEVKPNTKPLKSPDNRMLKVPEVKLEGP
jgi:hypothetical protein